MKPNSGSGSTESHEDASFSLAKSRDFFSCGSIASNSYPIGFYLVSDDQL